MSPFHSIHETDARVITKYRSVEALLENEDLKDRTTKLYKYQTLIEGSDGLPESLVNATLYECGEEWILRLLDIEDATYIYRGAPSTVLDVLVAEYERFGVEDDTVSRAKEADDPSSAFR